MNSMLKKAGLGIALAATALTAAAPADAQRYRGGYRGHGDRDGGTAIIAGIAGLAIGAAIASDRGRDRYRDDYYRQRGYAPNYDYDYYSRNGYYPNDGYYAYDYQRRGYRGCYVERRYDRYRDRDIRVRVCR